MAQERIAIAGSGVIATGLAACLANGEGAKLWARSASSAERARAAVIKTCAKLGDGFDPDRITIVDHLSTFADATLIIEAVTEDIDVKSQILRQLGEIAQVDAVLATTTSSLSVAALGGHTGRSERFVGLHVFNPVPRMMLVELAFPKEADAETRRRAQAFCAGLNKTAVPVPDTPGFVVNRLLFPYLFDAVRLMEETGLSPVSIDACMQMGAGHPMGPIALLDYIGLDVAVAIGNNLGLEVPVRIQSLVDSGHLGRKSGSGLYEAMERELPGFQQVRA